jgi:hypothetical protein
MLDRLEVQDQIAQHLVLRVSKVLKELLVLLDLQVLQVMVQLAVLGILDQMDHKVHKVQLLILIILGYSVHKGFKDILDLPVGLELQEILVRLVHKEQLLGLLVC